jgi:hypothetical protein
VTRSRTTRTVVRRGFGPKRMCLAWVNVRNGAYFRAEYGVSSPLPSWVTAT